MSVGQRQSFVLRGHYFVLSGPVDMQSNAQLHYMLDDKRFQGAISILYLS